MGVAFNFLPIITGAKPIGSSTQDLCVLHFGKVDYIYIGERVTKKRVHIIEARIRNLLQKWNSKLKLCR